MCSVWHESPHGGAILLRVDGDGPVDPVQFRDSATAALTDHPRARMTIDFRGHGRMDAATLAVIAQCWLALSERERELIVIPGDPADRPVLERLGFDDFYRVADAA